MDNIIKNLIKEHPIEEMVKFDDLNLQEKLKDVSYQIVKYRELQYAELAKLEKLENDYDKLLGIRYDHYRFEIDKELSKVEIEKFYLPKDKKVLHMKEIIRKQKMKTRFFEVCYKGFEKQAWNLKIFSENLRSNL